MLIRHLSLYGYEAASRRNQTEGLPDYGKSSARYAGTIRRDARHDPTHYPITQAYSLPYGPRRLHFSRRLCSGRRLRRRVSRDRRLGARPTPSRRARLKRTAYRGEPTAASRAGRRRDRHRDRAHLGSPTVYHQAASGSRKGVAALIRALWYGTPVGLGAPSLARSFTKKGSSANFGNG